jgi:hypothetical protein
VNSPIQLYYIDDIDDEIRRQREERKRQGGELVCFFCCESKTKNLSNNTKLLFPSAFIVTNHCGVYYDNYGTKN